MHNVLKIFRNDVATLCRHTLALIIIIAILFLPALYAWFNIYAFWNPYDNTGNIPIAVVCNDEDYMDSDGVVRNIGNDLIAELKDDDNFGYIFLDDSDEAINGVYDGTYYAAVVIESDFTYNMYNFLDREMSNPTIFFYQNEKTNPIAVKVVEASADNIEQSVNEKYISAIIETLFDDLNSFSSDVEGDNTIDRLTNTLTAINSNLSSYASTIDCFINANNSLIETLKNTNNTLNYSIYLIGNERVNISKQIVYLEDTQEDLALINDEVNTMLLNLQDSVQDAIYKLDRLYKGSAEEEEAEEALQELERQYKELIDYLDHSGLTGSDLDDAMSALNDLVTKIEDLRTKLGFNGSDNTAEETNVLVKYNQDAINALQTDYEETTVPVVYKAVTGYDYDDLTDAGSTEQSFESAMDFMTADTEERIDSIQSNLDLAQSTNDENIRNAALTNAANETDILDQELDALTVANDALAAASNSEDASASSAALAEASEETKSAKDVLDDILNGNRDIDLVGDLEYVSDALGATRTALTETVYPLLDSMIDDMQDTLGDISSLLLELSDILGKTTPIVDQLGSTFATVNSTLIQVKDLLASYSSRICDFIDVINGDSDDDTIHAILDFLNVDPEDIGKFFSSPVTAELEAVYSVENYGSAMAPFYTMLAIWVGCVIINSIVKTDSPVDIEASTTEVFFGRFLLFFALSLIQTLIIMLGDLLLLKIQCVHPGMFLLAGVITSLTCSMVCYSLAVTLGSVGKCLVVVLMIIQIAGSSGTYPIELLPDFFQQMYLFFPFPYAINAMREAIAGLYKADYIVYLLQLLIFLGAGLFIGLVLRKPLIGLNHYMDEQLEDTEMM